MHAEQGNLPSPAKYDLKGFFSPTNQSSAFSFGMSRENMKKLHLQVIEKTAVEKLPGPGQYQPPKTFGKEGIQFSMRPRTGFDMGPVKKSVFQPGPGHYVQPDLVGYNNANKFTSRMKSPESTSFPKSKLRFTVPTYRNPNPGPGNYSPMNNLNEDFNSKHQSNGKTKFGRDERSILEERLYRNVEFPGPGNYEAPTDFGRYDPPSFNLTAHSKRLSKL